VQHAIRWDPNKCPPKGAIIELFSELAPELVVGADAAGTRSGRALGRFAARLLARTYPGFVVRVQGDAAFERELESLAGEVAPARHVGRVPGMTIRVGLGAKNDSKVAIGTSGWNALAELDGDIVPDDEFNPSSAMAAASFGLIEVTKSTLRRLLPAHGGKWSAWDLEPTPKLSWSTFGPGGEGVMAPAFPSRLQLGELTFVSGGALTHAVLAVFLEHGNCEAMGRILDFDELEASNMNRYLLATYAAAALGLNKAFFLAERVAPKMPLVAVEKAFGLEDDVRGIAVVGADRVAARIDVQRRTSNLIVNGATELGLVRVSLHGGAPGRACLGCVNRTADPVERTTAPTIAFIPSLTGALMVAQLARISMRLDRAGTLLSAFPLQSARQGNVAWEIAYPEHGCAVCGAQAARNAG